MSRLIQMLLTRPLGGLALCLCLAGLGMVASQGIKLSMYTSRSYPVINVTTRLSGTGPREVEVKITRPVEEAMRGVIGLRKVYSTSKPGRSQVTLELRTNTDVSAAAQQVRSRLRRLRPELPRDARPPVIGLYNPAQRPVAVLGVSGGGSLGKAGEWARRVLKPELRKIDGVAGVEVGGAPDPEILVECDPFRLRALGLTVQEVARALSLSSKNQPGGHFDSGPLRLPIRTAGRVTNAKEVAALPITVGRHGAVVTLGQVARIEDTFKKPRELNSLNGKPVVTLALHQTWGGDLGGLWKRVQKVLQERDPSKDGYSVQVVYSQAQSLDKALGRLEWVALIAAGAAALVLFLFLRSLASTLVALAALPFSLLVALLLLRLMGLSLDLMALSGLALALGILVDNAVVVIEAVHHHWQKGDSRREGLVDGVSEVAGPIAFSTLTTVAAFLPLIAVSDRVRLTLGGFFWGMALSLCASLVAALVLVPVLMHYFGHMPGKRRQGFRPPKAYRALLDGMAKRRLWLAVGGLAFLACGFWLSLGLPFQSGGVLSTKGFNIILVTPPGTPKEITAQPVNRLYRGISGLPEIDRVHTRVWGNQGRLTVTLQPGSSEKAVEKKIRAALPVKKGIQFHILPLGGSSSEGGTSLTLNLFGQSIKGLFEYQRDIKALLATVPGMGDMVLKMGSPSPEMELALKHRLLGSYGISARQVAGEVRSSLDGPVAFTLVKGDQEVEVRVRARPLQGEGPGSLDRIFIEAPDRGPIPLTELVTPRLLSSPAELFREDFKRVVRLTLVMRTDDALGAAKDVRQALAVLKHRQGYSWSMDDSVERVTAVRREMLTGAALALILVYLIMVAASESLAGPVVVMTAAPFAVAGAVMGLKAMGLAVTMPVYLGAVILAGMLVNTGLVMIDAMTRSLKSGNSPREAAREGALRRFRPVMMSTLSTTAGALPLFLDHGTGSSAWAPLALTLASGLIVSALFALLLTPALFPLAARLDARLKGKAGIRDDGGQAAPTPLDTPPATRQ